MPGPTPPPSPPSSDAKGPNPKPAPATAEECAVACKDWRGLSKCSVWLFWCGGGG